MEQIKNDIGRISNCITTLIQKRESAMSSGNTEAVTRLNDELSVMFLQRDNLRNLLK